MINTSNSNINSQVNPVRNYYNSERQLPSIVVKNAAKESRLELNSRADLLTDYAELESKGNLEVTLLHIRNMVSIRCKMVVIAVLENFGLHYYTMDLGEVKIFGKLSPDLKEQLKSDLIPYGLELMDDNKNILVEKIKTLVIEMIHYSDDLPIINISSYLGEKLNHSYNYLANLFSEVKGMSIQHFIMSHKIERAKELLMYDELNISEIAWKLHYSSVAHLSSQFKNLTGMTPSKYKNLENKPRISIESI